MQIVMLIPAYNPDEKTMETIDELKEAGFDHIVVVDDGSKQECQWVFDELLERDYCDVLRHNVNMGKGRALKTAFNHIVKQYPGSGVIVCDADGQHPVSSVLDVAQAMRDNPQALVLAARQFFKGKNVPIMNLLGNTITRAAFLLLTGIWYADTQCGLRGFPPGMLRQLIGTQGERFEYENVMLLYARRDAPQIVQVPMEAVYLDDNRRSHFNRLQDSIRIYSKLIGFAAGPIISAMLSWILYSAFMYSGVPLWLLGGGMALLATLPFGINVEKKRSMLLAVLLCAVVFAVLIAVFGMLGCSPAGAWWAGGVLPAVLMYNMWLNIRYGKKPPVINIE